jgi:hypothetical protein
MKFDDFNKRERTIIAEFVYCYDTDILIKTDALNVIDVMYDRQMIDSEHEKELKEKVSKNHSVLEELIDILFSSIEEEEGKKIMNEFFGR